MTQQVMIIHGGTSFDTYKDYIAFIKTRELTKEKLLHCEDWRVTFHSELGDEFEVLVPKMPNGTNARYAEWCIWFERCASFLHDNAILIGHSLGGIFLAKYLSEHDFSKRITATILLAAPFDHCATAESLKDFRLPGSLEKLIEQGGDIYLIHSKDDPVVPYEQVEKYQQALPAAKKMIFENKQHFNQETFSELAELIRSI